MVQERGGGPALSQSLEAAVTPSAGGIDLALYIVNSGNKGALNARVNLVWPALEGLGDPVLDSSERIELEGPFETAEELIAGIGSHWYRWHADYPSGTNVGTHFYIPISRDLDFPLQVRIDAEDLAETVVERVSISVRRAE